MPSNARGERRERRVFQLIYDIQTRRSNCVHFS